MAGTGVGVEVARESDRLQDAQADRKDGQSSWSAMWLLKEGMDWAKSVYASAASYLPEMSLVSPNNRPAGQATDANSSNPAITGIRPRGEETGSGNVNLAMGNPSDATANPANADNYLLVRDQYVMSYNRDHKTPNWVSWQLDQDWLGHESRSGQFTPDDSLPSGFSKAVTGDYTGSGYDRGHNCPSGDRNGSREDNEATFKMSNIAPQAPDNNRGPWEKLEAYSRELAMQGKELYIVAGNEGSKGTIGDGVNVPEAWWKVIVVLPKKGMGPSDVTSKTDIIAVEMPNENGMKGDDWRKYVTTISAIERHTGYHFLSNVPKDIERTLADKKYNAAK
jgi:endonuclease G, mitochondrial